METKVDAKSWMSNVYAADCPTRQVLDRVGDKWSVLIIGLLDDGPKRFSKLKNCIGGISQKMLTQTLRNLERDGLVQRRMYPEIPPRVEYSLTELGSTLYPLIEAVAIWAEEHIGEVVAAQMHYDSRSEADV